jgi:hypothetical protein
VLSKAFAPFYIATNRILVSLVGRGGACVFPAIQESQERGSQPEAGPRQKCKTLLKKITKAKKKKRFELWLKW